ncbi:WD40 repeat-like protein [Astrocystis sublimbata]|nr:WD40 repeat-like protein [Astrocystis sublimbata]
MMLPATASSSLRIMPLATKDQVEQPANSHKQSARSLLRSWRLRRGTSAGSSSDASIQLASEAAKGPLGLNTLFEPSEPKVDIIFVHGLQGGSRKTWSLHPTDPLTYWPSEWLPLEPGFRHARIHSFGYDSDWGRAAASKLTVHDFALALLADIKHSNALKRNGNTPIVFVAHSMGGLVIKKAYLLATRNETYKDIASRIHTMYFLATPHRGSNSAAYLNSYLSLPLPIGAKSFVKELMPNSQTVHDINFDFRYSCAHLKLFSFFESKPMNGIMIVEKQSAIMGLPNEEEQYLAADHRHVCKFDSAQDPNYLIVMRKLKATIEEIQQDYKLKYTQEYREQLVSISKAFENAQRPLPDLYATQTPSKYHEGSCQWLTRDEKFTRWLDPETELEANKLQSDTQRVSDCRFLWLYGPPGSGKSIASGHAISFLESHNFDVCYYFFKAGSSSTVAMLLLSLAYQMAEANLEIRHQLFNLINQGVVVNCNDYPVIWNTLFLGCIFKTPFLQTQYWVIDALDECPQESRNNLLHMLMRINRDLPIKVFVSSRPDNKMQQMFEHERIQYVTFQAGQQASLQDIAGYLHSRPILDQAIDTQPLIDLILQKSDGIFLWATLMVDKLNDCYSIEDIEAVIKGVPGEMNTFYADIIDQIQNSPNAELGKCILKWIVSAPVPLSIDELREAIRFDIKRTLLTPGLQTALSQICRNLVIVNDEKQVQLMHQTVRTFLTSEGSNCYISERLAHENAALVCLNYMNGSTFQPRNYRFVNAADAAFTAFDKYAILYFAYHVEHSHSISQPLFTALMKFTETKALTWAERVAELGNLSPMIRVIKSLLQYHARRLKERDSIDNGMGVLGSWLNDFTRLVTNFGPNLIDSPRSIYVSIPPLLPTSSIIYKTYASRMTKQKVICTTNSEWEERASCLLFSSDAKSVASNSRYVAVGLLKKQIRVYDHLTLELVDELHHPGPVRNLAFGNLSGRLVSGSPKAITVWSAERKELWTASVPGMGLFHSVCFSPDDSIILAVTLGDPKRVITSFSADDGSIIGTMHLAQDDADSESDDDNPRRPQWIPKVITISPRIGLAAFAYRKTHLTICSIDYELNTMTQITQFAKEGSEDARLPPQVLDVAFCSATEYRSMAILYEDGDLVTAELDHYDQASQRHIYYVFARILAASPDGRILAVGENDGSVSLFAFETLQRIQRIPHEGHAANIVFSSSGLCLYTIYGKACNVWEPPCLLLQDQWDFDPPEVDGIDELQKRWDDSSKREKRERFIHCLIQAGDDPFVFCGRADGSITVHDVNTGNVTLEFVEHKLYVRHLAWSPKLQILYSTDGSRCIATQLSYSKGGQWKKLDQLFSHEEKGVITQLLAKQDEPGALISTRTSQTVWLAGAFVSYDLSTAETISSDVNATWSLHPNDVNRLLLTKSNTVQLYSWDGLRKIDERPISLDITSQPDSSTTKNAAAKWMSRLGRDHVVRTISLEGSEAETALVTFESSKLQSDPIGMPISGILHRFPCDIRTLLGILGSKVFFLTRRGWVCSYSLKGSSSGMHYARHFFIPPVWRTGNSLMMLIVSKSHMVLVHRNDLVILQRFLDLKDTMPLEEPRLADRVSY